MHIVVAIFFNLQYVSFSAYAIIMALPYVLPTAVLPFADAATFGLIPNVHGDAWSHLPEDARDSYSTASAWFWLSSAIGFWMFAFSAMRTLGLLRGWAGSVVLAILAVGSIGTVLHLHADAPSFKVLCLLGSLNLVYMSTTYHHNPERTGARTLEAFRKSALFEEFRKYFDGSVAPSDELLDNPSVMRKLGDTSKPDGQVMICFHPHGVFPSTAMWMSHAECWKKYFQFLDPIVLVATVIHLIPVMRDIAQWSGCRDVARRTVIRVLNEGKCPLIVIGGRRKCLNRARGIRASL